MAFANKYRRHRYAGHLFFLFSVFNSLAQASASGMLAIAVKPVVMGRS
ncbi:hypothetical protein ACFS07_09405 [Undibacterium arcticum]